MFKLTGTLSQERKALLDVSGLTVPQAHSLVPNIEHHPNIRNLTHTYTTSNLLYIILLT